MVDSRACQMTYYDILGVTRLSSSKSIKTAYRRIALASHPDKVRPELREEATRRFQEIQVAYDVLQDPLRRRGYDDRTFGMGTPPSTYYEDDDVIWNQTTEMPPTPESSNQPTRNEEFWETWTAAFDAKQEFAEFERRPRIMTFVEATLRFHPEDRRQIWLCDADDDPAQYGEHRVIKKLYVSLEEIFCQQTIEVSIFRYRYLENSTKVVEILRLPIKLKPFLSDVAATIDLMDSGNEYLLSSDALSLKRYKQRLSLVPVDDSELYGDHHEGQFFRHGESLYDVAVQHTIYKDDLRIQKKMWSFEIDIPTLNGTSVATKFKGRLRRRRYSTVLKGEGMWKYYEGGPRGNLYVTMNVV